MNLKTAAIALTTILTLSLGASLPATATPPAHQTTGFWCVLMGWC